VNIGDLETPTVKAIYDDWLKIGESEALRRYLGASEIGHPCERYLWYAFLGCVKKNFEGRMYRLFNHGDLEEIRLCRDLRAIGVEVVDRDDKGEQIGVSALGGHFKGHLDAALKGLREAPDIWHVGEFKTHNKSQFERLKQDRVQKAFPKHYAQMQIYMLLTGMRWAAYFGVCKDNDEVYMERVPFEQPWADALMKKAERIITAIDAPMGISVKHECERCDANGICKGNANLPVLPVHQLSCRQCQYATPIMDGGYALWKCTNGAGTIDTTEPCHEHKILEDLLNPHGDYSAFSSRELISLTAAQATSGMVVEAKRLFSAKASHEMSFSEAYSLVCEHYPTGIWTGPEDQLFQAWRDHRCIGTVTGHDEAYSYRILEYSSGLVILVDLDNSTAEIRCK